MAILFEEITAARLEKLSRDETVFFFPVGPLEDHGPHLPLGLDLMEAQRMAVLTAERLEKEMPGWTGVIMPRAPLGIDANTSRIALTVRPYILRDWLIDACRSLSRTGFRHFVCFSGNLGPKQLTAIEEAGSLLRKRGFGRLLWLGPAIFAGKHKVPTLVSACSALVAKKDVKNSALWPDPVEHGGQEDTSVALAIAKALVDPGYNELPAVRRLQPHWKRTLRRIRKQVTGCWGAPGEASAAHGEAILKDRVDNVFTKLRAVWEGSNPEGLFRSWYSVIPPNKSFFRAWLIILFLALIMAAWIYVVFEALIPS